MKMVYFASDINDPATSDAFRSQLVKDAVPFTEIVMGKDSRPFDAGYAGIQAVIVIDGNTYQEIADAAKVSAAFMAAPNELADPPVAVNPLDILKAKPSDKWTMIDLADWLKAKG